MSLRLLALFVTLLGLGSTALGQPMMPDPAQMSGIPRPDPQVAPGTVTVRLIRGAFTSPIVDQEVTLTPASASQRITAGVSVARK